MPQMTYIRGDQTSRIFLAIPAQAAVNVPCVASLVGLLPVLSAAGIGADFCFEAGNCHVDDARNSLVRQFLQTDCTDLIFIDSDVGFRAQDLLKLVTVDRDVVAGVYPKKQDEEDFPVFTAPGTDLYAEDDGCVEVLGAPTGFMRIRRHVLERMVEAFKDKRFQGQSHSEGDALYTLLFEREIAEGRRWSGDYNFCRRWRALGGTVHVLPEMEFIHEGLKQWKGSLGAFWKRVHGVSAQIAKEAFERAIEHCKQGDPEPQDFMALVEGWNNPWSASPEFLATAYRMAQEADGPILECGSGLSTVVMATTGAVIHALEHDPIWAMKVRDTLEGHGLKAMLECHPLTEGFYRVDPMDRYPLVVIDGPPRGMGNRAKAFQYASASVLMDDTSDPTQSEALKVFAQGREVHEFGDKRKFSVVF